VGETEIDGDRLLLLVRGIYKQRQLKNTSTVIVCNYLKPGRRTF
jgi:hypothetical protein